ncbi:MAG: class I SAM-dependent methyltransferase [candidate division Zixibacteria bacterium]|nr:class I SAM-dependent methyltransferase [Candidatus Tariuqbacter arcticus]
MKKEHFRLKFKLINNYIKPPGRMLDIGCASGFLIEVALEQGWDAIGIDINTYFEKYLDLKLKGKVVYGTLQNVRLNDNFHLITMFDVLEHSLNPREDLLICKELLTSNGVIVVQIPCIDSIGAKTFRKYWYHYGVPAHLSYFSLKTFTKLVENIELEVVQHCWTKKLFSAKYLLFQLMTKYFSSLGTSMNIPVIENIKFGVPMSERLLIIRNRQIT